MPVCITGMHRSGTSMVARLLNLCGLYLGPQDKIMPPKPDNPQGFWENMDFAVLNENILMHLGGRWNSPPSMTKNGWESDPMLSPFKNTAADIVQGFTGQEPWGWKDPRASLTLPFWNRLLPDLKLVICIRNPLAVARSLQKRNQFSVAYGIGLWHQYNQSLLAAARSGQYVITHYDAYFNDPKTELFRILVALGWEVPAETVDRACQTISADLRNNRFTTRELMNSDAPSKVLILYQDMCATAAYVDDGDSGDEVDIQTATMSELEAKQAYEIARTIIKKRGHEEAIDILKKLLERYPTHSTAHNDLGVLYFQKGDKKQALEHFKAAFQQNPRDITTRKNIADCYLNLGQTEEAVVIYEKILADNPDDVETLLTIGNLCRQAGRYEDAAYFYESVLRIRSGDDIQRPSPQGLGQMDTQ